MCHLPPALFLVVAVLWCRMVGAHPLLQNTWWVTVETNRIVMRVSSTLREVSISCGPAFNEHLPATLEGWHPAFLQQGAYLRTHLQVTENGQPLDLQFSDWTLITDSDAGGGQGTADYLDQTRVAFDLLATRGTDSSPLLHFATTALEDERYAPGISWEVVYAIAVKMHDRTSLGTGIVRPGLPFDVAVPTQSTINLAASTSGETIAHASTANFGGFLRLGIHHILTGYDHLLFLASLALAAMRIRDFLRLVVVFTAAHSLTVTCSAMNWVRLPPWFVEPFIALSIILVALENGWAPRRAQSRWRLVTAFGFGLVHGLGFATGLNEAIGGEGGQPLAVAIIAFCLGVEFGHLLVGVPFWSLIAWMARTYGSNFRFRIQKYGSNAIAIGGAYFLVAAVRQYF